MGNYNLNTPPLQLNLLVKNISLNIIIFTVMIAKFEFGPLAKASSIEHKKWAVLLR